jgi:glycosyltransferase involved in cell wall biosynthesis
MSKELSNGISVLIPAYGECEFLMETLQSLEDSSRPADEILLVDDGINPMVLREVEANYPHIKVLRNSGKGLVDALNTGLFFASFDLVARIDADDCVNHSRFEIQEDFMRLNLEVVLCGSQINYINTDGDQVGFSNYLNGDITEETRKGERCLLAHPSVMYRTLKAQSVGGYRKLFTIDGVNLAEDFDFWVRLSRIGIVFNLEEKLTRYRQHPGQLSMVHRGPQEIASYFIHATALYENSPGKIVNSVVINSQIEALNTINFVRKNLGYRQAVKYGIEIKSYYSKINPYVRRLLVKFF